MPSSITLTVSNLPASTAFFLSALQPLNYVYRGRSGDTIGFGPPTATSNPPDFWIMQETPGVPAGAAHVAFPASSRARVQDFFSAALRAGGKIHGEPTTRDASGYYSAAVIDFDGNSIEAVFRPMYSDDEESEARTIMSNIKTRPKQPVLGASGKASRRGLLSDDRGMDTTASTARAGSQTPKNSSGDIVDNLFSEARTAASVARNMVSHVRPNMQPSRSSPNVKMNNNRQPGDSAIGTLLGVAAGAALAYAVTSYNKPKGKNDEEQHRRRPSFAGRSATDPPTRSDCYYEQSHRHGPKALSSVNHTSQRGLQRYITLQDREALTDTESGRPRSITTSAQRRNSFDGSAKSRTSARRLHDAAPPTSYRSPATLTSPRSRTSPSTPRSELSTTSSRHSRADSARSERNLVRVVTQETLHLSSNRDSRAVTPSTLSATKPLAFNPLPPSRAATWGGSGSVHDSILLTSRSKLTKNNVDRALGSSMARRQKNGSDADGWSRQGGSVVGKARDVQRLDVSEAEVRPCDSVSQVSSNVYEAGRSSTRRRK